MNNKILKQNAIMMLYITILIDTLDENIKFLSDSSVIVHKYQYKRYFERIKEHLEQCLKECNK